MKAILHLSDLLLIYARPNQAHINDFRYWFPIFPSKKLAELCGFLIGDGHIQGAPRWRIDFTSNNLETLDYVNSLFYDLFGVGGKVRLCKTNKYGTMNLGVNCKPLARTLFLCGVPKGAKVETNFLIPKWIVSNSQFFRSFIRSYFSCEACVDKTGKIMLEQWKTVKKLSGAKKFMTQIIVGLNKHFDIFCSGPYVMALQNNTKKGVTQGIRISIRRKGELCKYTRLVGFVDIIKQSKANSLWCDT